MLKDTKMYNRINKHGYKICVCLVLLISIVVMCFNCYGSSLHGDEFFSLGFANNTENFLFLSPGVLEEYTQNEWLSGDFLHDWLSVQEDGQFAIYEIYKNVKWDVHPPLYFMLLNFVSSFWVDELTLVPGSLINIASGTVICIFIYLITRKVFRDKWIALIPPLFWVLSSGGDMTVNYIRMYAPLCALTLICLYLHMLYLEEDRKIRYVCLGLFFCTMVGTVTHYYYYLVQFVLFCMMVIVLLVRKDIPKLFGYGMSLLGGEIISYLAWPYVTDHLFSSNRGVQVQENLANSDWNYYKEHWEGFRYTLNTYVYDGKFKHYAVAFVLCVIASFIIIAIKKRMGSMGQGGSATSVFAEKTGKKNFFMILFTAVAYFLILFKISYSTRWLYVSPIFSMLAIITVGCFVIVIGKMQLKRYGIYLFLAAAIFMLPKSGERIAAGMENNAEIAGRHEKIVSYSDNCDILFFYDEWDNLYDSQIPDMIDFDQIRICSVAQMDGLDYTEVLESRQDEDDFVLYIPTRVEGYQDKIEMAAKKMEAVSLELICEGEYAIYSAKRN